MEWRTFTYVLLFAVWSGIDAIKVTVPQKMYERARGDNISLPCTFQSAVEDLKLTVISWTSKGLEADAEDLLVLTYHHSVGIPDIHETYEGRASLDVDIATGKANLNLYFITLEENKNFECRVQIPKDGKGTPTATTRLVVLVAPSPPICKVQGRQEYGQNISLTCNSEEGSPPPTYKWDSYDVQNQRRLPQPRTIEKDGILSLFNISKETSGFYICTSTNKIRSASCNLTVAVMPPSMSLGSTGGIIGGVIAVLIVIAILIICCCCCKKKKSKEEQYAMGKGEGEYYEDDPNRDDGQDDSNPRVAVKDPVERRDNNGESSERNRKDYDDRRSDYDDRRSDYNDRRSDYDDRRSDYNDRRSDYDDRRSDYNDRRSDYDDRRSDYNDRRNDYDDRRSDSNDRRERYDDRNYDDRRDRR